MRRAALVSWSLPVLSLAFAIWTAWHTIGVGDSAIQVGASMAVATAAMVASLVVASTLTALAWLTSSLTAHR